MTTKERALLLTAVASLAGALTGAVQAWTESVRADTAARERDRAKRETARAYESYGEYTEDQLRRDEAILRALRDCQDRLPRTGYYQAQELPEPQAQAVLDEIARREGWAPEGGR